MKKILVGIAGLTLAGLSVAGLILGIVNNAKLNSPEESIKINPVKIYSTNDIHGRLVKNDFAGSAGIHSMAGYLETKSYDLLLDGGDLIQGQALNDTDKGKTMAEIVSTMEYDGIAVGNHEFDFGLENILAIDKIPGVNFLSANTRYRKIDNEGKPTNEAADRVFEASRIVTLDSGLQAGIIGLTTLDTAVKTHPDNVKEVIFTDLITETEEQIKWLENQGINFIIVVSHVGAVRNDVTGSTVQLAEALPGKIDLIVDGHTQVDYNIPVISEKGVTQIIQTGEYTESIRETHFNFNSETGQIEDFKSVQIPFSEIRDYEPVANPVIDKKIQDLQVLEGEVNNVVIVNDAPVITDNTNGRKIERPMPNMVSDSNLWAANSVADTTLHADLAIMNTGGVRVSLPSGELLRRNAFEVLPFGNQLRIASMPGSVLQEVVDFSIRNQNDGSFLSFSDSVKINVTATLLPEDADGIELINQNEPIDINIQIKNASGAFENIDPLATYKVAMNDFLLAGGDGYTMLDLNNPEVATKVKVIAEQGDMLLSLIDYIKHLDSTPELRTYWENTYKIDAVPTRVLITRR